MRIEIGSRPGSDGYEKEEEWSEKWGGGRISLGEEDGFR